MYRKFYGFTDKPFQLSPDSRFYYNSKPHNRAMAYLRYGLEKREGFIVITGGIGTGKTMLVRHLLSEVLPEFWSKSCRNPRNHSEPGTTRLANHSAVPSDHHLFLQLSTSGRARPCATWKNS